MKFKSHREAVKHFWFIIKIYLFCCLAKLIRQSFAQVLYPRTHKSYEPHDWNSNEFKKLRGFGNKRKNGIEICFASSLCFVLSSVVGVRISFLTAAISRQTLARLLRDYSSLNRFSINLLPFFVNSLCDPMRNCV